jgi:hypothetical protein
MAIRLVAKTRVDVRGLWRLERVLKADLRQKSNGPIRKAMRDWVIMYNRFLRRRFLRFSRGGGSWRPLAPSTKRRKRRKKAILRETDTLLNKLFVSFGQSQISHRSGGITVSYGRSGGHPDSSLSVGQLTKVHQEGRGIVPRRPIIVPPSKALKLRMNLRMQRALLGVAARSAISRIRGR